ncbi:hypothetical protein BC829DRAFT_33393 [Chytridium lagenaria]|nr:hypothetical protein BC829DRAFT_33393 [Chytridium lagenaria]
MSDIIESKRPSRIDGPICSKITTNVWLVYICIFAQIIRYILHGAPHFEQATSVDRKKSSNLLSPLLPLLPLLLVAIVAIPTMASVQNFLNTAEPT